MRIKGGLPWVTRAVQRKRHILARLALNGLAQLPRMHLVPRALQVLEAAFRIAAVYAPRLVAPYDVQPLVTDVAFVSVCRLLDAHTSNAMAALEMDTACMVCGGNPKKCEEEQERLANEGNANLDLATEVKAKS